MCIVPMRIVKRLCLWLDDTLRFFFLTMNAEITESCAVCKKPAKNKCSGCKITFYCGREHQKAHWKKHSVNCRSYKVKVLFFIFDVIIVLCARLYFFSLLQSSLKINSTQFFSLLALSFVTFVINFYYRIYFN